MNRLENIFSSKDKVLAVFDCAGAPDMLVSAERIRTLFAAGADIVELGIPFSDPIADGAAVQSAYQKALANGANLAAIVEMIQKIRSEYPEKGLLVTGYFNVFLQYGLDKIFAAFAQLGIDGVRILDLPFEEYSEIAPFMEKYQLKLVAAVSRNSSAERIKQLLSLPCSMVCCEDAEKISFVKDLTDLPVAAAGKSDADCRITASEAVEIELADLAGFVHNIAIDL